ncbi:MAG: 30S ribosomal protein S4 [Clostridia bacterium]|nr:30S ribosomal protein S4 [Clostridia bacterium]
MARYIGESCRVCRREGEKLFLKGSRCYTDKCAITRRAYAPGQHGQKRKKQSEYGTQLREKQKAKAFYGVLESQFRKYFEEAERSKGITGTRLLQILESRLDNVVYRLGLATSRAQARQLVRHGHFTVNGTKVNIPSYLTKVGDVIKVKESSANGAIFKSIVEATENGRPVPTWLESDLQNKAGKIVALPAREEIDLPVQEHLIVELYSK